MWTAALLLLLVLHGLVFFHELGHLLAAKWAGMPVTSFSVGFGPPLLSRRIGSTRYQIALIPLGGFVKIPGMAGTDEDREKWPDGFAFHSLPRRMLVISAGVLMNAVVAGAIYAGLAVSGGAGVPAPAQVAAVYESDVPADADGWSAVPRDREIARIGRKAVRDWGEFALALLGAETGEAELAFSDGTRHGVVIPAGDEKRIRLLQSLLPPLPPVLGRIQPESPARAAGLHTGDRILSANGAPIDTYDDWLEEVLSRPAEPLELVVRRGEERLTVAVSPEMGGPVSGEGFGWIGAHLGDERHGTGVGQAVRYGANEVERNSRFIAESGRLLVTGGIGLRELAGPVEIARMSSRAFNMNWYQFLAFAAFLSLNLAIFNFLPIPVLDGGHFFLLAVEGLFGRPLPHLARRWATVAGATVVGCVMAFAVVNDLLKVFGV